MVNGAVVGYSSSPTIPHLSDGWHELKVVASDSTYAFYVDSTKCVEYTPMTQFTSGGVGVWSFRGPVWFDNLEVLFVSSVEVSLPVDAWVGVDTAPPTSSVDQVEPYWQEAAPFTVSAAAQDALSGVASVELYYRSSIDDVNWTKWKSFGTSSTAPYEWSFTAPDGYALYEFRSVASDVAGNIESAPGVADATCGLTIPATVDIDPDTLNLRSQGRWITAYIELPSGFDLASVNVNTITLEGVVPAEPHPTEVGDHDGDGVPDLMVKFDREAVQALLEPSEATLTVTGNWHAVLFKGGGAVRVIESGGGGDGPEVSPGQSGERPGQGPPVAPPGQDGSSPAQGNQEAQGQGPPQTSLGQANQPPSQGQPETPPGQGGQSSGQDNQGNQGNDQGGPQGNITGQPSGQGNGQVQSNQVNNQSPGGSQGNGQGDANGSGNHGEGNGKGKGK